jgi:hypothetical protein
MDPRQGRNGVDSIGAPPLSIPEEFGLPIGDNLGMMPPLDLPKLLAKPHCRTEFELGSHTIPMRRAGVIAPNRD